MTAIRDYHGKLNILATARQKMRATFLLDESDIEFINGSGDKFIFVAGRTWLINWPVKIAHPRKGLYELELVRDIEPGKYSTIETVEPEKPKKRDCKPIYPNPENFAWSDIQKMFNHYVRAGHPDYTDRDVEAHGYRIKGGLEFLQELRRVYYEGIEPKQIK